MPDSLLAFDLSSGLHAGRAMMQDIHAEARSLLAALAYCAMALAGLQGLLAGTAAQGAQTAVRAVICLVLFDSYDEVFTTAVTLADNLAAHLRERSVYLQSLSHFFDAMLDYAEHTDSIWDLATGLVKGSVLASMNMVSHWSVLLALVFIMHLTLVALNVLYVLGPLMIAAGVFCEGLTLRRWAHSLCHVLLWPVFPCFVMLVSGYIQHDVQLAADNLSAAMMTNVVLFLLIFISPLAVACILSGGGAVAMGSWATAAALRYTSGVVGHFAQPWRGSAVAGGVAAATSTQAQSAPWRHAPFNHAAAWPQGGAAPLFEPPPLPPGPPTSPFATASGAAAETGSS